MLIRKFKHNLFYQEKEVEFSFHPMNVRQLQLFQVYVNWNDKQLRFHMQSAGEDFKITDAEKLPAEIRTLQDQLSQAIRTIHRN